MPLALFDDLFAEAPFVLEKFLPRKKRYERGEDPPVADPRVPGAGGPSAFGGFRRGRRKQRGKIGGEGRERAFENRVQRKPPVGPVFRHEPVEDQPFFKIDEKRVEIPPGEFRAEKFAQVFR